MAHTRLAPALPVPPHFESSRVAEVWRVPYQDRAGQAESWSRTHRIVPAAHDRFTIGLLIVDAQNTFCIENFELFVGGRSGRGAVEDNQRLCEFVYRNLARITRIVATMDAHRAMQIFHPLYLVDDRGAHPEPFSRVTTADVEQGRWKFNSDLAPALGVDADYANRHLRHYVRALERGGKYELTVWPYHAMLGGIGHALVSSVEEAVFFHGVARATRPDFQVKGENPLTEHYSVFGPEVTDGPDHDMIGSKNEQLFDALRELDAVIIAGQAKSHCVAWTVEDLLATARARDPQLPAKVYLLEDCASPVVVAGVVDYTEQADAAYSRFAEAGMHLVKSTEPMEHWPGLAQMLRRPYDRRENEML